MTANNAAKIKIGIIGGSGIDYPKILKNPKEIKIQTPFGNPASELMTGQITGRDIVVLARHGKSTILCRLRFRSGRTSGR